MGRDFDMAEDRKNGVREAAYRPGAKLSSVPALPLVDRNRMTREEVCWSPEGWLASRWEIQVARTNREEAKANRDENGKAESEDTHCWRVEDIGKRR